MIELLEVTVRTLLVSGIGLLLSSIISIPLGLLIVEKRLRLAARIAESLIGIPTVLIGLSLYLLLSHRGPLGFTHLLYTPIAISIGEAVLVTPIYIALLVKGLEDRYYPLLEALKGLGVQELRARLRALKESTSTIISASIAAYSRAIGELGVALLVGGNIRGYTRTLATSISLHVSMGEYDEALIEGLALTAILATLGIAGWVASRLYEGLSTSKHCVRLS